MKAKSLALVGVLLLMAGTVAGGVIGRLGQSPAVPTLVPVSLLAESGCDLMTGPCLARRADLIMSMSLPEAVTPLRPFPVEVTLAGNPKPVVTRLEARLQMPGMTMNPPPAELSRQNGRWQGRLLLPFCSSGRQDWQLLVTARGAGVAYAGQFPLSVGG